MATREELDKAVAGVNGLMYGGRTIRVVESLPKDQIVKESTKKVAPGTFFIHLRVFILHKSTKPQSGTPLNTILQGISRRVC
jgi:RNA recognition motif-containing protein